MKLTKSKVRRILRLFSEEITTAKCCTPQCSRSSISLKPNHFIFSHLEAESIAILAEKGRQEFIKELGEVK